MKPKTLALLHRIFKRALAPIPKISVSEWADKYRMLSSEASAAPGRWKTSKALYQKEIMDAFTQPKINKVVVKSASQIGKSDIMNNVIARFAHIDPCPIMMIQPTIEMGEDFSKSRIATMIRDTPVLSRIFADVKSRISNNTILSKLFPGGRLVICGANSPAGLASRPIRILLADELDRFPTSAGTEGDPLDLAAKRTTTFWNRVIGEFSTPTLKGVSKIESEYLTGTQEEWQHQCPNCQTYSLLSYANIIYSHHEEIIDNDTKFILVDEVRWQCPLCGFEFDEQRMKSAPQQYIAKNPMALHNGVRSFFVNSFASPWISWREIVKEYLEALGDTHKEQVVWNTRFGETYEVRGTYDNEQIFLDRREEYTAELPEGVLILTAAVDTQDNRLEYEVCGWGVGEECWGIRKGVIIGVPDQAKTWAALDEQLDRVYNFANGSGLVVARTFIDSGGHYTKEVYQYCKKNFHKGRFAIKGSSEYSVPLIHKYSKVKEYVIFLIIIGVSSGKQHVMSRLTNENIGEQYFHFPVNDGLGYDDIYFKGLLAEKLVPKIVKGQKVLVWQNVAKDKRNEALDLRVYNLACVQSINPNWQKLQETIAGVKPAKSKAKKNHYGSVKRSDID